MADSQYGKIGFDLACRFGELTRNAIRVLVYLYACRNEETGQCNPKRKKIIADTDLDKSNLSKAITELEKKGFVVEFSSGCFELISAENIVNPYLKVGDSPTKVVDSPTRKVVKSPTEVGESPTKSWRITNTHNKDFEQRKNRERTEKDIFSAHETFSPSDSNLTDEEFSVRVDETFLWLRQKKNLKRLPQSEWIQLFTDLEAEDITLDKFKEFYLWVENLDWVTGAISIKLLRGQIETYKNREHFEAKKIIKGSNGNGKIQPNGSQFNNSKLSRDEYALREREWLEQNRAEVQQELNALRKSDVDDR